MSHWLRYAAVLVLALAVPTAAYAQSDTEKAATLNDEGKELWLKQNNLAAAVKKFQRATELDPKPSYFFNLCYGLHQLGRFREALTACKEVEANGDAKLKKKAKIVIKDIDERLANAPPPEPDPGTGDPGTGDPGTGDPGTGDPGTGDPGTGDPGTGDPGTGDPGTGDPGTGDPGTGDPGSGTPPGDGNQAQPPGPIAGLYQPAERPDDYKWSVGGSLGVVGSSIGGDSFGGGGVVAKLYANFLLLPNQRIGVQGYINWTQLGAADEIDEPLSVTDVGVAAYKHIPVSRFYVTPLVGIHGTAMLSNAFYDELPTFGVRAEAALSYLFGPDRHHVISVVPTFNFYAPVQGTDDGELYDLEQAGTTFAVTLSYTMRFTTSFGQRALFTLE